MLSRTLATFTVCRSQSHTSLCETKTCVGLYTLKSADLYTDSEHACLIFGRAPIWDMLTGCFGQ